MFVFDLNRSAFHASQSQWTIKFTFSVDLSERMPFLLIRPRRTLEADRSKPAQKAAKPTL
jgi:hypothetical protein